MRADKEAQFNISKALKPALIVEGCDTTAAICPERVLQQHAPRHQQREARLQQGAGQESGRGQEQLEEFPLRGQSTASQCHQPTATLRQPARLRQLGTRRPSSPATGCSQGTCQPHYKKHYLINKCAPRDGSASSSMEGSLGGRDWAGTENRWSSGAGGRGQGWRGGPGRGWHGRRYGGHRGYSETITARRRRSQKETKILLKQMVPLGPPDAQPQNQLRPCPGLGNTVTIYPHLPIYISAPKNYVMSGNSHKYCNLLASWRINRVYLAGRVSFFFFSFLLFFSLMFINLRVFLTELFLRC